MNIPRVNHRWFLVCFDLHFLEDIAKDAIGVRSSMTLSAGAGAIPGRILEKAREVVKE